MRRDGVDGSIQGNVQWTERRRGIGAALRRAMRCGMGKARTSERLLLATGLNRPTRWRPVHAGRLAGTAPLAPFESRNWAARLPVHDGDAADRVSRCDGRNTHPVPVAHWTPIPLPLSTWSAEQFELEP